MAEETKTEQGPKIRLVYMGMRLGYKGDVSYYYQNKETGKLLAFDNELGKVKRSVGALIECEQTDSGVRSPYVPKGYDSSDEVIEWRSLSWSAEELIKAKKAADRNKKGIEQEIEALREKYKRLTGSQRSLFISSIVYEITK